MDYLSPEPLLQSPSWVASQLRRGYQVPSYSYARNNPTRYIDYDGLSPRERAAILSQFDAAVNRMTWDSERLNSPNVNNIAAVFWRGNTLRGCGEQASYLDSWLRSNVELRDYSITAAGGRTGPYGFFPHQWLVASSPTDDSVIVLDPWANEAWETRFFSPSIAFSWPWNYPLMGGARALAQCARLYSVRSGLPWRLWALWSPLGWLSAVFWCAALTLPWHPSVQIAGGLLVAICVVLTLLTVLDVVRFFLSLAPIAFVLLSRHPVLVCAWGSYGLLTGLAVLNSLGEWLHVPGSVVVWTLVAIGFALIVLEAVMLALTRAVSGSGSH